MQRLEVSGAVRQMVNRPELVRSQEPTTGPCAKPNKPSARPPTPFLDLPY